MLAAEQRHVDALAGRLGALDPVNMLRRGWTITCRADGTVVRSVADAAPGESLVTRVADGEIESNVQHTTPNEVDRS